MKREPLVSIVTPSLNQARFIRNTIESILSQDYPNLEYWIIDGGSKDETIDILKSYGDRIHWTSEQDAGQSQAVNKGWHRSHGEILGWVNADDLLKPSAVRHAVEALSFDNSIGAVYGRTNYIDEAGNFIQEYPAQPFDYEKLVKETENYVPQPSVFARRDIVESVGFLDESLQYLMDYDLWLRMGSIALMKYLDSEMASLRLHTSAKTVNAMPKFGAEFVEIFRKLFASPSLSGTLGHQRGTIMHRVHIHAASFCFWGGETRLALKQLRKAWDMQAFPRNRTFWLILAFSALGKTGWKLAEALHGNPMRLEKGLLSQ